MSDEKRERLQFGGFVDWAFISLVSMILSYSAYRVNTSIDKLAQSVHGLERNITMMVEKMAQSEKVQSDHENRLRHLERREVKQ